MAGIPEVWYGILDVVRGGEVAWRTPVEIAEAMGWDIERTCDELAALDVAGWLEVWEPDEVSLVVTLSALAAERLGVRLVEHGHQSVLRWAGRGDPEPAPPRARRSGLGDHDALFESVLDPHPTTEELALSPTATDGLPCPTVLIGLGLTPWPGPAPRGESPCPACGSSRLDPDEYCLRCDSWGRDPDPATSRSAPAATPWRRPGRDDSGARRRFERERRKARRRARFSPNRPPACGRPGCRQPAPHRTRSAPGEPA